MYITTYAESQWDEKLQRYVTTYAEGYEYDGKVSECKGGGSSAPEQQTVTQTQEVPEYVKPYARDYLERADVLSDTPFEQYQGQRIADFDPLHTQGIQQTVDAATGQIIPTATDTYMKTTRGDFLGSNPFVDQMSAANRANALGGSAYQEYADRARFDLGQNLNNLATQIYGGNYMNERGLQQQAMMSAPQMLEGNLRGAQAMLGAGDIRRGVEQDRLNLAYEDFERARLHPYANLDVLGNALGISMGGGGTTITQQPSFYQANPLAGAIGGGTLGYMGANMIGQNPYAGAALGALGGSMMV
jgi:hypothetical protein